MHLHDESIAELGKHWFPYPPVDLSCIRRSWTPPSRSITP